uniref:Uncharacterized protein n=1 Tax=Nelumbo nucifera TaxID=4432 RepID=A0A822Y9H0_NELNU|nr:TPA_asm: hypothetical protein HUJ06_029274 [Nelumbo nucifera]
MMATAQHQKNGEERERGKKRQGRGVTPRRESPQNRPVTEEGRQRVDDEKKPQEGNSLRAERERKSL